jgi:hypothetical protein
MLSLCHTYTYVTRTALLKHLLLAIYLEHSPVSCDIMEFELRSKIYNEIIPIFKIT